MRNFLALITILSALSAIFYFLYSQIVKDEKSRKSISQWMSFSLRERYFSLLTATLNWLDANLGKPFNFRSVVFSFGFAFFYPFFFMVLAWILSDEPLYLGDITLFTSQDVGTKVLVLCLLLFGTIIQYWIVKTVYKLFDILISFVGRPMSLRFWLSLSVLFILIVLILQIWMPYWLIVVLVLLAILVVTLNIDPTKGNPKSESAFLVTLSVF